MKKGLKIYWVLVIVFSNITLYCQKHDNGWLWGVNPHYQDSAFAHPGAGNAQASFLNDTFITWGVSRNIGFFDANTSYSDVNGNLLLYTNGMWIMDTTGSIIEGGDSLGYGAWWEYFEDNARTNGGGIRLPYSHLFIPKPNHVDSIIYLFYFRGDTVSTITWNGSFCFTEIEKNGESSEYKVNRRDVEITKGNTSTGGLAACKHGNGRDWWILYAESYTNCYERYLLTPDTIMYVGKQCMGTNNGAYYLNLIFSTDGNKAVRLSPREATSVFNFDRCSGLFTDFKAIDSYQVYDEFGVWIDFYGSVSLSSSGKYVYLSTGGNVYRFDTDSPDLNTTKYLVDSAAIFVDTFGTLNGLQWSLGLQEIGMDGKIYIGTTQGRFFTRIYEPDSVNPDYRLREISAAKAMYITMPHFPNYRTGRKLEAVCDTLFTGLGPPESLAPYEPELTVFPNPALDYLRIEYNWIGWEWYERFSLQLCAADGRIIREWDIPKYSSMQQTDISMLSSGLYFVHIKSPNRIIKSTKWIKR